MICSMYCLWCWYSLGVDDEFNHPMGPLGYHVARWTQLSDLICTVWCWPAPSYDCMDRYWPAPSCDHIVIWYCADQEQMIILIRTKSSFVSWALSDRLMHFDCCIMINAALHVYYLHFIWLIFCYYWDSYESHSFQKLKFTQLEETTQRVK